MKGRISTEFTVWCGTCIKWHQLSAKNQKSAIIYFSSNGWKKIKPAGWICPVCLEKLIGS